MYSFYIKKIKKKPLKSFATGRLRCNKIKVIYGSGASQRDEQLRVKCGGWGRKRGELSQAETNEEELKYREDERKCNNTGRARECAFRRSG